VAGEAVDEVVLAAMGLVGDDDDIAPVRKHGVAVARLGGREPLDGGELPRPGSRLDRTVVIDPWN
jgi:hypothetical protein